MTVKDLKALLKDAPDNMLVYVAIKDEYDPLRGAGIEKVVHIGAQTLPMSFHERGRHTQSVFVLG